MKTINATSAPPPVAESILLGNRFVSCRICRQRGVLTHLARPGAKRSLIVSSRVQYRDVETRQLHTTAPGVANAERIACTRVTEGQGQITATWQDMHVQITTVYQLPTDSPFLRIETRVRGTGKAGRLGHLAMPGITFTENFLDAFEDEVDRYFDGAELGQGRELPCWRVFHQHRRKEGLIIATRSKADMAKFNILARGVDVEPHVGRNYRADPVGIRPPLLAASRTVQRMCFEIGPWSLAGHRTLLRAARLGEAVSVVHPPARGTLRSRRSLKGKLFHVAHLASRSAAGVAYHPRRWMIADMPVSQSGQALFATTGVNPPPVTLDPKLKGLHRIHVGIANGCGATLRVTGDPELRYRMVPNARTDEPTYTFGLSLTGRQRAMEVDFGVVAMDGKKVTLGRFPDRQQPCVLDYIRFEKLSPAAAAHWRRQEQRDPILPLSGLTDTPDIAWILDADDPDPRAISATIRAHADAKVLKIHWRIDGQCSDFPSQHNTMRYISAKTHGVFTPHAKAYGRVLRKTNILTLATAAAKKYGVQLYGWMRFNNYSGNVQSDFFKHNPHLHEERENGKPASKLCIGHPEVRAHKIRILVEAAKYGLQGLCLGFLRHPPAVLYGKVMRAAYERRYGKQAPRDPQHPDAIHACSPAQRSDPEYERWWHFRAEYLTTFARELKASLSAEKLGHLKIAIWVRPNHCLFDGIDIDTWLREKLCDEVVTMHYNSGCHDRELNWETPQWREKVRRHVPLIRALEPDINLARPELKRMRAEGYDGFCSYESNDTVLDTRFINLYRSLRK